MKTIPTNQLKDREFAIAHSIPTNERHEGRLVQRQSKNNRLLCLSAGPTAIGDSWGDRANFLVKPITNKAAYEIISKMDLTDKSAALSLIKNYDSTILVKKKYTVIHYINTRGGIIAVKKLLNTTNLFRSIKNLDVAFIFDGWLDEVEIK